MMHIVKLFLLFTILVSCNNQNNKTKETSNLLSNKMIIIANVNVRTQPMVDSKAVTQLHLFDSVEILLKRKKLETISKKRDYWYKISKDNKPLGWVFGAYTSLKLEGQKTSVFKFNDYSFGDLEHLIFTNIKTEKEIDFGQGYNNLNEYNFTSINLKDEEYTGNKEYIGKKFKITFNNILSNIFCDVPESYEGECILPTPTIIKIELM
jgi:hypothetical protein